MTSLGFSVGDIVALVQVAAGIYSSLKETHNTTAYENVKRLQQDLCKLSSALNELRTLIEVSDSGEKHHEQGDHISAAMCEELQMLVQKSRSFLGSLKRLVDQEKHGGHSRAIIWFRKLADIKHLTQKWDMYVHFFLWWCGSHVILTNIRRSLRGMEIASYAASSVIPSRDRSPFGMVGEWRIHTEPEFAIIDSKSSSDILLGREHITEGDTDVYTEAGPLEPHRRHEGDQQDRFVIGVMGVTGSGSSSFYKDLKRSLAKVSQRLQFALQKKLPEGYRTSFDGFDGSSVTVRQIQALKHGSTYHLEANSNVFLHEEDLNLFLSSESPIQQRTQPRSGGNHQPRDGGALQPRYGGAPRPGPLRICDHKINHGSPATYKGIIMDETYPDTFHPRFAAWGHIVSNPAQPKSSQKWFDWDRTMAAPAALISLACALCMHNYDANRHAQPAGHLMRPIPIWSAINDPSPPMLVAATMTHGIATLAYYALRPGDRFRESFLGIGLVSAAAVGYGIGADTESVLIGILPLATTMSLLVCTLMNLLLKGCGVGSSFEEGRERDLEKQSGK